MMEMEQVNEKTNGLEKEFVQTSNRLYFMDEAIKKSSRTSSRTTFRATSPTAAGIPTVTRIPDRIEQKVILKDVRGRVEDDFSRGETWLS
jgi:hypothetical protein